MNRTFNMGEDGNIGSYRCQRNDLHAWLEWIDDVSRLTPLGSSISVAVETDFLSILTLY